MKELDADREKARAFKWSLRGRRTEKFETVIYSRNFSWKSGASLGFDRTAELPSALEQLLGSLLSDVLACFAIQCSQRDLLVDEIEATVNATLNDTLAAVGLESGDASIKEIALILFVTSPATSSQLTDVWHVAMNSSPIFQTLNKGCEMDARIVLL